MEKKIISFTFFTLILLLSGIQFVIADAENDIQFILNTQNPPKGVVFEIIENGESQLEPALDQVNKLITKLKTRRPELKIAVVSHGTEQFALLNKNSVLYSSSHQKVQAFITSDIPVHVCGTHASWYGLSAKDFPSYVDVAVAGPAKIREYQHDGYALVEVNVKN